MVPKLLFHNGYPTFANIFKTFAPTVPKLLFHNASPTLPMVPKLLFQLFTGTILYFHNSCQRFQILPIAYGFKTFVPIVYPAKPFLIFPSHNHMFGSNFYLFLNCCSQLLHAHGSKDDFAILLLTNTLSLFFIISVCIIVPLCQVFPLSKTFVPHLPMPMDQSMMSPLLYPCPWLKVLTIF